MAVFTNALEKINFNISLGNLNINVVTLNKVNPNPDWYVPDHVHSDFEFHIIPQGKGKINIDGCNFEVNEKEFYITGPMVRHSQLSDKQSPMMEYCLECEINILESKTKDASLLNEECVFLKQTLSGSFPYAFKDIYDTALTFEEIFREAEMQKPGFLLRIQVLLFQIVLDLFRTVCSNENLTYKYPTNLNSLNSNRIQRLIKYIDANYNSSITIEDVARILLLSPRQINRLMLNTFRQTFHDYLLTYRMHMAEKLLSNTTLTVEEIAYEAGFSSHYYMYQVFKRRGKPTPAAFRRDTQNERSNLRKLHPSGKTLHTSHT